MAAGQALGPWCRRLPLRLRIGAVLGGEHGDEDRWWTITSGTSLEPVAASVTEALYGKAIPLLREQLTDAALRRWLEDPKERLWPPDVWRLIYLSVLLATQGQARVWTRFLSSSRAGLGVLRVRPGWLSTSRTCASGPWRQGQVGLPHAPPGWLSADRHGTPGRIWRRLPADSVNSAGGPVAERVQVRELGEGEGMRLLRIPRRGTGSVVTWRRAQMLLLSAQGMPVPRIAEVTFTLPDRVRDVIHNFNTDGFDSIYPRYRGGRPPTFTLPQRQRIKRIALSRPHDHDLPFPPGA